MGASLFLIAVGAILRWAVSDRIEGIDLSTAGLILLVVGAIGLLIGLFTAYGPGRRRYVDEPPP